MDGRQERTPVASCLIASWRTFREEGHMAETSMQAFSSNARTAAKTIVTLLRLSSTVVGLVGPPASSSRNFSNTDNWLLGISLGVMGSGSPQVGLPLSSS